MANDQVGTGCDTPRNDAWSPAVAQELFPWILDIPCWLLDIENSADRNTFSDGFTLGLGSRPGIAQREPRPHPYSVTLNRPACRELVERLDRSIPALDDGRPTTPLRLYHNPYPRLSQ